MRNAILTVCGFVFSTGLLCIYLGAHGRNPLSTTPQQAKITRRLPVKPAPPPQSSATDLIVESADLTVASAPVVETIALEPVVETEAPPPVIGGALLDLFEESEPLPPLPITIEMLPPPYPGDEGAQPSDSDGP